MKNIDEKILMAEEEIKQLQNKRKKLINQQKQEERTKRDRRLYEKGERPKSRWLLCTAWTIQKCLLLLASKGKGSCPYAEWICGSTATSGGFLLLSISKVNSVRKWSSFRDWRKHADGFTGKCYKGLEKCLTMLPDSNTFTSVPDTQTLDVVLTALSQ